MNPYGYGGISNSFWGELEEPIVPVVQDNNPVVQDNNLEPVQQPNVEPVVQGVQAPEEIVYIADGWNILEGEDFSISGMIRNFDFSGMTIEAIKNTAHGAIVSAFDAGQTLTKETAWGTGNLAVGAFVTSGVMAIDGIRLGVSTCWSIAKRSTGITNFAEVAHLAQGEPNQKIRATQTLKQKPGEKVEKNTIRVDVNVPRKVYSTGIKNELGTGLIKAAVSGTLAQGALYKFGIPAPTILREIPYYEKFCIGSFDLFSGIGSESVKQSLSLLQPLHYVARDFVAENIETIVPLAAAGFWIYRDVKALWNENPQPRVVPAPVVPAPEAPVRPEPVVNANPGRLTAKVLGKMPLLRPGARVAFEIVPERVQPAPVAPVPRRAPVPVETFNYMHKAKIVGRIALKVGAVVGMTAMYHSPEVNAYANAGLAGLKAFSEIPEVEVGAYLAEEGIKSAASYAMPLVEGAANLGVAGVNAIAEMRVQAVTNAAAPYITKAAPYAQSAYNFVASYWG